MSSNSSRYAIRHEDMSRSHELIWIPAKNKCWKSEVLQNIKRSLHLRMYFHTKGNFLQHVVKMGQISTSGSATSNHVMSAFRFSTWVSYYLTEEISWNAGIIRWCEIKISSLLLYIFVLCSQSKLKTSKRKEAESKKLLSLRLCCLLMWSLLPMMLCLAQL